MRKAKVSLHPDDPSKTVYTVLSDAEGRFQLDNIDPGRYTVESEKEGFVSFEEPETSIDLKPGKDIVRPGGEDNAAGCDRRPRAR